MTVWERQHMERTNAVAFGVQMGWVHLSPAYRPRSLPVAKPKTQTEWYGKRLRKLAKRRAANIKRGLRWDGAKLTRKHKPRPSLKGLIGKDYHREHTRLWRAERKQRNKTNE
jgi:hypothetical protein